jgi:hypothetical protein
MNIDVRSNSGQTPLRYAVNGNDIQVERLLLEHGADVNARDNKGKTPSEVASELHFSEIAELLSEYGAGSIK